MKRTSYTEFSGKVNFVSGLNSLDTCAADLLRAGCKNIFLVCDKNISKNGLTDLVVRAVEAEGTINIARIYRNVDTSSSVASAQEAYELFRAGGCDSVMAVGGGSVIDVAKALVLMIRCQSRDLMALRTYNTAVATHRIPFIVVPTTIGSGTEVTRFATVFAEGQQSRIVFVSDFVCPDLCVLDARMVATLTPRQVMLGAVEILCNAAEAYLSLQSSVISERFARQAVMQLRTAIQGFMQDNADAHARLRMMRATVLAGVAYSNALVGLTHATASAICARYPDIEYAAVLGVLLPHCLIVNKDVCADKYSRMFVTLANEQYYLEVPADKRADAFVEYLFVLLRRYHEKFAFPLSLRELGVREEDLPQIAAATVRGTEVLTNPKRVSEKEVLDMLQRSL